MIYYNFDGIRLPKPVELNGYDYQLICSNKDELFFTHSLMISKAPFEVLNDKICFDSAVDYQFYTARNNSTSWSEGSLTIIENDKATTTLASVIDSSDFLWTNEDIYRYESDEIVYKKFKAEEDIVALKPEIKTNLSQDKYYYQDDENIETLEIIAESPDGGELSYQWYKNGEKIEGAIFNTYKPIITEIGKNTYYCEITNNYQGDLASINSKTITITIAEALVPISEEFLLGWKIGRLVAMLRGQQEPVIPDIPDTAMYLYGTPSEMGNIGLRVGDSVTRYEGCVAANIDEVYTEELKEQYGAAVIGFNTDTMGYNLLLFFDYSYYYPRVTPEGRLYLAHAKRCFNVVDGQWVETSQFPNAFSTVAIWSNVDIDVSDGISSEGVYLYASDPIPVSGIVGYKYGESDVLPDINTVYTDELKETHPYALIVRNDLSGGGAIFLYVSESPLIDKDADLICYHNNTVQGKWTLNESFNSYNYAGLSVKLWANHDVVNLDGAVLFTKSADPIPVYE